MSLLINNCTSVRLEIFSQFTCIHSSTHLFKINIMEHLSLNEKHLTGISFEVWSKEAILRESVCEVSSTKRTIENGKFANITNSVRDPRLGPLDRIRKCQTCGKKMGHCNGHFGHITLAEPVYHVSFTRQVIQWLKCICRNCEACLLKDINVDPSMKRVYVMNYYFRNANIHSSKCPTCGVKLPKYTWNKEKQQIMRNSKVYKIYDVLDHLKLIPESILNVFSVCHPAAMIQEVLPVPPPTVRPAIIMGNSLVRGEDDLTYRLLQILRFNKKVKQLKEENRPGHVLKEAILSLQFSISSYIDHKKGGGNDKTYDKEYSSIKKRLTSKEGRVRGNLMGKRVNFTARSVITGDDNIPVDTVGIPEEIADTLTVAIRVTDFNKNQLSDELRKSDSNIKYVINPKGNRFDLKFSNKFSFTLETGWVVERKLIDGDIVIFNRQPTLHLGSLMAHYVKVMPGRTFRMNLCVTAPYNADCK